MLYAFLKTFFSKFSLFFLDIFFFNLPLFFSYYFTKNVMGVKYVFSPLDDFSSFIALHFLLSIICVFWFGIKLKHYTYRKPFWSELKEILRTLLIFSIISLAVVGFSKWQLSRYLWIITWILIYLLIPITRSLAKYVLNKYGLWRKKTVIIGNGTNAQEAYFALQSSEISGFDVIGFYAVSPTIETNFSGVNIIKSEDELWATVDLNETQFFIAVEFEENEMRDAWLRKLTSKNCHSVSIIPTLRGVPLYSTEMFFVFSHEVILLHVNHDLVKGTSRFLKRAFDILASLIIFTLISPIILILVFMISKNGGKPIYIHERVGLNGKRFNCLKFRSMVLNSKEVLDELLSCNPEAKVEWDNNFKLKNDPRVTKIGQFIRKTSLDELPQLWNVLIGEMSLVGPRPIVEEELVLYGDELDYYYMAKPGMTGLWQISGRNDLTYADRVYFDTWYVKNWSLWNDVAILFKTINVVLGRSGAY